MLPRLRPRRVLRSRHRGRDRAAGADPGQHGASLSAAAREIPRDAAKSRLSVARAETWRAGRTARDPEEDAGRAAVPGTGDAHRDRGGEFTPVEADRLRRAMATFKRVGTIEHFHDKFVSGWSARGYDAEFAERCFSQIRGFGEYGFPGKPRGELREPGLCLMLDEVLLPGRVRRRAAQQPADGILCAGADRARCARAWRRGAAGRRESFGLGLHAGALVIPGTRGSGRIRKR